MEVQIGKKAPKAPAPPDPYQTAQAQTQSNVNTAIANAWLGNANQNTPYGNLSWNQTGTRYIEGEVDPKTGQRGPGYNIPTFTATQTLSPADQQLLDKQNAVENQAYDIGGDLLRRSAGNLSQPLDYSGLPNLTQDFSADRRRVEDAFMSRFNEDYDARSAATRQRLANQGVAEGTEAANAAFRPIENARNDALSQAILAGGQEQSRLQGLNMQTRQQGIQERTQQRYEPINVASGLFGLGPGVQNPQFQSMAGSGVAGTDVMGAYNSAYQGQLANWNAQNQSRNATMGGIFGLAGSVAGGLLRSDRRVKIDIRRVGTLDNGLAVYLYRYRDGGPFQIGVMADEVAALHPGAVVSIGGVDHVDYRRAVDHG